MLSMDVSHPDIVEFIKSKADLKSISGANISIKITNDFINAVKTKSAFELKFKDDSVFVDAEELWDLIAKSVWKSGDPGVLFWDNIISASVPDCYSEYGFKTISTNPCKNYYKIVA